MRLVVDASVATKWLVPEDNSDIANDLTVAGHELLAPRLMAFEVGNTLWRKARRGEINQSQALQLADMISAIPVVLMDNESLNLEAIQLALTLNHPVYDCVYLALAYQTTAVVVTADMRFANVLAGTAHEGTVTTLGRLAIT